MGKGSGVVGRKVAACVAAAVLGATLTGCGGGSSGADITGVWSSSDNTVAKVVNDDGTCTGIYYNGTTPLDIGGQMTCALGDKKDANGAYRLVVRQPPNQETLLVTFTDPDTVELATSSGEPITTLTRQ